ncbi:MAG: bifunctional salicylyl-CoA 5-hydroxylase/oxidoreductase [Alphaproteobacteria bacterium]|nr:MAG: bifunctional salicylyl-CoA 5-hydroxylase/oxidoreductase [Alphaproteobacteria bacterium]
MNIDVVGGGPAGLFFAILHKKQFPSDRIVVRERNRPNDTFGFGVVLSKETLGNIRVADPESYAEIERNFAYWDDIFTRFRGHTIRSTGHGFCGIARLTLLEILQARAEALGVELAFETEDPGVAVPRSADLVVAADGVNSAIRETWAHEFQPQIDLRPNKFCWMGSTLPLPGFTFLFKETPHGIFNIHAYQFAAGKSTLVVETTGECWQASGLATASEADSKAFVEALLAEDLDGHPVLTNRSVWRNFPTIRCKRWHHANVVLVGDAAHTAHYSIGSGTKLAMEDAIALATAVAQRYGDVPGALAAYETARRDEVSRTQHAAEVSLGWFEHVRRYWDMHPIQFNFSLLSRSKQITFENLRLRDPAMIEDVTTWYAADQAAREGVATAPSTPPMFLPLTLRGLTLGNRVVVSPMCQYSAVEGSPTDWHLVHLGARATGGAGLVVTEMTAPSADGRISPGCTGLYSDQNAAAWQRVVQFVHEHSEAKICLQLGHAGRKGSTQLGWEQMDRPLPAGNWPILSASAIPYLPESQVPREASEADLARIIAEFQAAARRAASIGFDMLEVHMAHGYLLASFISPLTNQRRDGYGGSLEARMRFPLAVFDAVRAVWPEDRPISVRISATDWEPEGVSGPDSVEIARMLKAHGCDIVDVSTGQTTPNAKPIYGRMYQAGFAEAIRTEVGIPTIAVGAITSADQVNTLLASGRADLCALARPHLADAAFTLHAAAHYGVDVPWPKQYLAGKAQAMALARR